MEDHHRNDGALSLEWRRTITGVMEDSHWSDTCLIATSMTRDLQGHRSTIILWQIHEWGLETKLQWWARIALGVLLASQEHAWMVMVVYILQDCHWVYIQMQFSMALLYCHGCFRFPSTNIQTNAYPKSWLSYSFVGPHASIGYKVTRNNTTLKTKYDFCFQTWTVTHLI